MKRPNPGSSASRAMEPPKGSVISIDAALIEQAIEVSRKSPRGRVILPFHGTYSDPLQRMLNALQPGSYIQPHRHLAPPKAESIVVLKGAICYVSFKETGETDKHVIVSAGSDTVGIDTEAGVYHTFFALEEDTVLYEVKPGPYDEKTDKDFAIWAPAEGSAQAKEYLRDLHHLVSTP